MRNLALVVLLVVVAAAMWASLGREPVPTPVAPALHVAVRASEPVAGALAPAEREVVEAGAGVEQGAESPVVEVWAGGLPPTRPSGWPLDVHVVDQAGAPVAAAEVTWVARADDRGQRAGTAALTDADGRTRLFVVGAEVVVHAEKPGVGDGVGRRAERARERSGAELLLVIEPFLPLRGRVQDAAGAPLVGATVYARDFGGIRPDDRRRERRPSVAAGEDGAFELRVQPWRRYRVSAALEARFTFSAIVEVRDAAPEPIVLEVPGAIGVQGAVLDARGVAVPGADVVAWRGTADESAFRAQADAFGRFHVLLPAFGEYQVMATHESWPASTPLAVAPDAAHPHAQAVLTMPDPGLIRGVVVDADGGTRSGVQLVARVVDDRRQLDIYRSEPRPDERYGGEVRCLSAADGAFVLSVHPRGVFSVQAVAPDGEEVSVRGVVADGPPLRVVLDGATCALRASVTRQDGGAVGGYRVMRVEQSGPVRFTAELATKRVGSGFTAALAPIGRQCLLRVEPDDVKLAPAVLGPVEIVRGELDLTFVLQRRVACLVEVFGGDGVPLAGLRVAVIAAGGDTVAAETDRDGRATLEGCVPGPSRLRCLRGADLVHEQPVDVVPGGGRVTVLLPAANSSR
ncbi:MAG: hypothetical protein H6835_14100 [Planctomycetes bacterium]|nr:hypothetical protein [Planctomycetota bacterium]